MPVAPTFALHHHPLCTLCTHLCNPPPAAAQLLRAQEEQERRRQHGEAISAAAMAARERAASASGHTLTMGPLTPEERLRLSQLATALEPRLPLLADPPAPAALRHGMDLLAQQAWFHALLRDPAVFSDDERYGEVITGMEERADALEARIACTRPFLEGVMAGRGFGCPGHDVASAWLRVCDEMERLCALLVALLDEPVRGAGGRWRELRARRHAGACTKQGAGWCSMVECTNWQGSVLQRTQ